MNLPVDLIHENLSKMEHLVDQFKLIQTIRDFFKQKEFTDVMTPPMVQNPGMEVHIHPFEVFHKKNNQTTNTFLHTSPEFHMKRILASKVKEFEKIFTLTYCFRDEPDSPIHRNQFIMLEWYRKNAHYHKIKEDLKDLINYSLNQLDKPSVQFTDITIQELFIDILNLDILNFLDPIELRRKIEKDFKEVPLPESELAWDDLYFLLFLNLVEPHLRNYSALILDEYPAPLRALSTIKENNSRVCERFELYINGIEIANCFNELTNYKEQIKRFETDAKLKKEIYNYNLPWPSDFLEVLENGYPKSAGIALGVERLLMSLNGEDSFFTPSHS